MKEKQKQLFDSQIHKYIYIYFIYTHRIYTVLIFLCMRSISAAFKFSLKSFTKSAHLAPVKSEDHKYAYFYTILMAF